MKLKHVVAAITVMVIALAGFSFPANALEPEDDTADMLLWYRFDEGSGADITDASGNGLNAQLMEGEDWAEGKIDGAVNLTGVNYILLPEGVVKDLTDFTITAWVNQGAVTAWQRLLDIGNDTTKYIYWTLFDGAGCRFSINNNNSWQEFTATPVNDPGGWHFVAVTKSSNRAVMYIDGVESAVTDTIEYTPSDLGPTTNNYIGKSQYPADANYNGRIDDFRIYKKGMGEIEIQNIMGESLSDEAVVALNKAALTVAETFAPEEDLELKSDCSNGVSISWSSNDPTHLSNDGKVTRPAEGEGNAEVELTATLTKNEAQDTKIFKITILEEGATPYTIQINTRQKGVDISPNLYGIFFEDINYAADGGLYPELVQNRSFEFNNVITKKYDGLYAWELIETGGGLGTIATGDVDPLNDNNPNYLTLTVTDAGEGVGIWNTGFPNENTTGEPGMAIKRKEKYTFSMFARSSDYDGKIEVTIEGDDGSVYARRSIEGISSQWQQLSCTMIPRRSSETARLVVKMTEAGTLDMDMISLFPQKTWKNRKNGIRYDLGKMLEAMHPKFLRFPGGCVIEGNSVENIYRWKDTVGKLEERKMNYSFWHSESAPYYHQSFGLGFYEYFQMAEDLKAEAIPVVNAGLTAQSGSAILIPMEEIAPYIQDTLDLIEFANGDVSTQWGALRAEMGHPEPFNMKYLAVGNENHNEVYFERYEAFASAIRAQYPGIKLITSSGPQAEDADFMEARAWIQSGRADADLVDEHYYRDPAWFYTNINRYDNYDRSLPKVFLGEYASRGNTMKNALAEAAFMTTLEENSDIVELACYAPLLAKQNFTQWMPDAIWFNNTEVFGSVNYHVQEMFANNVGQVTFPTEIVQYGDSTYKIKGKFGVGGYNTATVFDDVTIVDNNSGEILFSDDFSEDASNWTAVAGQWEVVDGQLVQSSSTTPSTLAYAGPDGLEDYTVTLKAMKTEGQEGFLLYFGLEDGTNYLRWNLGGYGNTRGSFEAIKDGVAATISEFDLTKFNQIDQGQWYELKAVVSEKSVKCYLNGELAMDIVHNPKYGPLYANSTYDPEKGDLILKVINPSNRAWDAKINLDGIGYVRRTGTRIELVGESPTDQNTFEQPDKIVPEKKRISGVSDAFTQQFAPYSVNILKLKAKANF